MPPANQSDALSPAPMVFASRPDVSDSATLTRRPRVRASSLSRSSSGVSFGAVIARCSRTCASWAILSSRSSRHASRRGA